MRGLERASGQPLAREQSAFFYFRFEFGGPTHCAAPLEAPRRPKPRFAMTIRSCQTILATHVMPRSSVFARARGLAKKRLTQDPTGVTVMLTVRLEPVL